jgi:hypothetical protein
MNIMSIIDKSDLKYDYTWSSKPAANPRSDTITQSDTQSRVFNREEGEGVLSIINEYAKDHEIKDKNEALRIEGLIRSKLGDEDMTFEEVMEWLEQQM